MKLDGSNVADWTVTARLPGGRVRIDSPTLATWLVCPASMIAAAESHARPPQVATTRGGELLSPDAAPPAGQPSPGARARHTDPSASGEAAQRAAITAGFDAWLVLAAHVAAGEAGLSGDELATWTCRKYESVGPRRPWLQEAGWVALTDVKRARKGVYVATDAGRAAWSRVHPDVHTNVIASLHGDAATALQVAA